MLEGEEKYLALPMPRMNIDDLKDRIEKTLYKAIDIEKIHVDEIHVNEVQVWATVSFTVPLNIITVKDDPK